MSGTEVVSRGGKRRPVSGSSRVVTRDTRPSAALLFALMFLGRVLTSAPESLTDLFAIVCLGLVVWSYADALGRLSTTRPGHRGSTLGGIPTVPIAAVALWVLAAVVVRLSGGPLQVLVPAVILAGADVLARRRGAETPIWSVALQRISALFAVWLLLVDRLPWVEWVAEAVARGVSAAAAAIAGASVLLGPDRLGLDLAVLFAIHVAVLAPRADDGRGRLLWASRIATFALAPFVGAIAFALLAPGGDLSVSGLLDPLVSALDVRPIVLLVLFGLQALALRDVPAEERVSFGGTWYRPVLGPVLLVIGGACALLVAFPGPRSSEPVSVLVFDSLAGARGADVPVYGEYGLENVGTFGLLPYYLEGLGHSVAVVTELGEDDLEDVDVLVIMNLRETFDEQRTAWIHDFVSNGGALLLAGDHTSGEEIRDPSNALLEPYGISLAFDSAVPLRDGWASGFARRSHPVFADVSDEELQVLIGASLEVKPPARTVLFGRDGFSDPGDPENEAEGALGDLEFGADERLGDLPLVAEASSGAGRVLVFGDTTTFQNPALPRDYRFVAAIFEWLATDVHATWWAISGWVAAIGLAFTLAWMTSWSTVGREWFALLAVTAVFSAVLSTSWWTPEADAHGFAVPSAVIDLGHFEGASSQRMADSVDGLTVNLQRSGYAALIARADVTDRLEGASVLVVPAAQAPFSQEESARIEEFVADGGTVIVTAGYERPAGSRTLLERFGVRLGNVPLGEQTVAWDMRPIHLRSAWPVEPTGATDVEVLAEAWGHPVIVRIAWGRGSVLVVGDASFLLNRTLEDVSSYNLHNIEFLRDYLDLNASGGAGDA